MNKTIGFIIVFFLCCGAVIANIDYSKVDPIVEARGIWIDAGAIPKTAHGIREMVRCYNRTHFNILFPETICRGYAIYPSKLITRDPRFAGEIDPLPILIDEAHKLGMEVHPWVWVFRVGYTNDNGSILRSHPDWAELDRNGHDLSPNGGYWISPANPSAREYLTSLFTELATNYCIDGLHLDYIRYESEEKTSYGYSQLSRDMFMRQYGTDPLNVQNGTLNQLFWNKFRERQINTFVQTISLQIKAIRPCALISAAVGPYPPDARLMLMQNWPNWVANKWVDFVTPMSYSSDNAYFGRLILRQKEAVGNATVLAEGIGMFLQKDPTQTINQIGKAREMGALGQVMFSASYFGNQQLDALTCGPYAASALLPFRDTTLTQAKLITYANGLRCNGSIDLADYYIATAQSLALYNEYHLQRLPYIAPTAPSITINY